MSSSLGVLTMQAQVIKVSAPQHVGVGEQFKLMYTIQTQDVSGFRSGNIPEGLDVLMGPSTSQQSSFQMVNGHTSSSSSITYTYILCAEKAGTYTIGPARARVAGKDAASPSWKIKVSGQSQGNNNGGSNYRQQPGAQVRQAGAHISGNDLFIKVSANKKRVHEQEPVLLTYKVYTQVELTQLEGKMPDLKGFHTQEVQLPQQKSFHIENVNGRPYRCVTWSQYVMYPQMTGKMQIPAITFKGIVVQENRNVDPFEAFFNGGSGYIEVKKDIVAPAVDITVDPLPQKPANYSGAVGKFTISGSMDKQTVTANDPVNIRVVVSGIGNLKLIKAPSIALPKDFDKYDPKVTDKTSLTANGIEGNMVYDFLVVPRNHGDFTIPAIEFVYYDTDKNAFNTVKTQPFTLHVNPGKGGNNSVTDYSEKDKDIYDIMPTEDFTTRDSIFFGTTLYWAIIAVIFLCFITLIWFFRQRAIERADIVGMKGKNANKMATKKLKKAYKLMLQKKQNEFYDEVLRALWGYVSDKLNIPVSELSRDNITEQLISHNVDDQTILTFVDAIDECEYARYAPGEPELKMDSVYKKAMKGITDIENFLKGNKHRIASKYADSGKVIGMLLMLLTMSMGISASTKTNADDAYRRGNYQEAIKGYTTILSRTPSAEVYYNLGNCYFRSENITQAIIAYHKALLLSPENDDIKHNLHVCRTKTIDKIQPVQETFIQIWWNGFTDLISINSWAVIAIISLLCVVLMTLTYLFVDLEILRKLGFYSAIFMLLVFALSTMSAMSQYQRMNDTSGGVIIKSVCQMKKSPDVKSQDAFVVHEGTHLRVTDETIKGWLEVVLDDGTEGWIPDGSIERIIVR